MEYDIRRARIRSSIPYCSWRNCIFRIPAHPDRWCLHNKRIVERIRFTSLETSQAITVRSTSIGILRRRRRRKWRPCQDRALDGGRDLKFCWVITMQIRLVCSKSNSLSFKNICCLGIGKEGGKTTLLGTRFCIGYFRKYSVPSTGSWRLHSWPNISKQQRCIHVCTIHLYYGDKEVKVKS